MDKIYKCTVVVTFQVKDTHEEYLAHNGAIVGFTIPNGRIVRPIIGLEVTNKSESAFRNLSTESAMTKVGFSNLDYQVSDFEEDEVGSQQLENDEYEDMTLEELPKHLEPRFESTKKIIERRLREGK